jgi:hypothetical protein
MNQLNDADEAAVVDLIAYVKECCLPCRQCEGIGKNAERWRQSC